jgi:uncharacterized protein YcbK (DUF882 family)
MPIGNNFNFMRPMPQCCCSGNFGFQFPMFQSLFAMFNSMMRPQQTYQNPWAVFGWQPATVAPVINNYNFVYNQQPINPFTSIQSTATPTFTTPTMANPAIDYYNIFMNASSHISSNTQVDDAETTKKTKKKSQNIDVTNLSDTKLAEYGFDTAEKRESFKKLKPEMQKAVVELTEYAISQGMKITYASKRCIFRTRKEQEEIYKHKKKGYAAKPGTSRHEKGEAVDITIVGANCHDKNDPKYKKLAQKWQSMGYTWGGNWKYCEPWHFDLRANNA